MILFLIVILLIGCGDILAAIIYDAFGLSFSETIRSLRIFGVLSLGLIYFLISKHKIKYFSLIFAYTIAVIIYSGTSVANGLSLSLVLNSAVSLTLCILLPLTFMQITSHKVSPQNIILVLNSFALINIVFGVYEVSTDFWLQIGYDSYLSNVKGIELGLIPDIGLPWNFYHYNLEDRRLAGLIASPLALGPLLASVSVLNFVMYIRTGRFVHIVFLIVYLIALYYTNTRAAMLGVVLSVILFSLSSHSGIRNIVIRFLMTAVIIIFALYMLYEIILMTVTFSDGSTIGHLLALKTNVEQIVNVILFGYGVGVQGAHAASINQATYGGGEGAFFTIAYSLGLPFSFILLTLLLLPTRHAIIRLKAVADKKLQSIIIASHFALIGQLPTLLMNEQFFSFSGNFYVYLMSGYVYSKTLRIKINENTTRL